MSDQPDIRTEETSWQQTFAEFEEPAESPKPTQKINYSGPRPGTRSPKTIKKVLKQLQEIWKRVPQMSLAELIREGYTDCEWADELFEEATDDQLLKRLRKRY